MTIMISSRGTTSPVSFWLARMGSDDLLPAVDRSSADLRKRETRKRSGNHGNVFFNETNVNPTNPTKLALDCDRTRRQGVPTIELSIQA